MKTKSNVLLVLAVTLFSAITYAQRGVRIAYVDMEYILENVEEYREATEQLANKVDKWKVEVEQKQSQVEQMKKDCSEIKKNLTVKKEKIKEDTIAIITR